MDLKQEAKTLFFDTVKVDKYRESFLEKLKTYTVIDKRDEGFYCCHCRKFSKTPTAFETMNKVCHPRNSETIKEIWLVNDHYDGCFGWD